MKQKFNYGKPGSYRNSKNGTLLAPASIYFELLSKTQEQNLPWLRQHLVCGGMATLIAAGPNRPRQMLSEILSFATGRKSFEGLEGLLLSCMHIANETGERALFDGAIHLLKHYNHAESKKSSAPLFFYDRFTGLLTVFRQKSWNAIITTIIEKSTSRVRFDVADLLRTRINKIEGLGNIGRLIEGNRNPVGGVLVMLGAASDTVDCVIPWAFVDKEGDVVDFPGTNKPFQGDLHMGVQDNLKGQYVCSQLGGRIDRGNPPDAVENETIDQVIGNSKGDPVSDVEWDQIINDIPDPPPSDGQTLDEVLGEPDPPMTDEEIDSLINETPNPDSGNDPTGPAGTPNPDNDGGPRGPAATPNPDDDRGPRGPAATPRPDDEGGPGGPAARGMLIPALKNRIYFPGSGAVYSPLTGIRNIKTLNQLGSFIGVNGIENPTSVNFFVR